MICHASIEEFQKSRWAVLRLHKAGKGYVCRAKPFYENGNIVCIGDIESDIENRGYGSRVLSSLIKICQQLKVKAIIGEISGTDSGHLDKLDHFYAKHGFKLTMYKRGEGRGMIGKVERRALQSLRLLSLIIERRLFFLVGLGFLGLLNRPFALLGLFLVL